MSGLILGGEIGNQIDRLRLGHVTDFLLFQAPVGNRMAQFPAFNVADSCITVGVILMALLLSTQGQRIRTAERPPGRRVTARPFDGTSSLV